MTFEKWWNEVGSAGPAPNQEHWEHVKQVARMAWDHQHLAALSKTEVSFRARSKIPARSRANASAVVEFTIDLARWFREHFNLPTVDIPDFGENANEPRIAALMLRRVWDLGNDPIDNVVELLESKGVHIFSLAEDAVDVDAFCFWNEKRPFVILNQMKSGARGRFDACHELAHLVLHRQRDLQKEDVERDADVFASEFLVPQVALRAQLPSQVSLATILRLKREWNVSAMAMLHAVRSTGCLSEWMYRTLCVELSSKGYRSGEPDEGPTARESSAALPQIFAAVRNEGLMHDLQTSVSLHQADISPLVFGLADARGAAGLRLVRNM